MKKLCKKTLFLSLFLVLPFASCIIVGPDNPGDNNNQQKPTDGNSDAKTDPGKTDNDGKSDAASDASSDQDDKDEGKIKVGDPCNPITHKVVCDGFDPLVCNFETRKIEIMNDLDANMACKNVNIDGAMHDAIVSSYATLSACLNDNEMDTDTDTIFECNNDHGFVECSTQKCVDIGESEFIYIEKVEFCSDATLSAQSGKCVVTDADRGVGADVGDECNPLVFEPVCYNNGTGIYCGDEVDGDGDLVSKVKVLTCGTGFNCSIIPEGGSAIWGTHDYDWNPSSHHAWPDQIVCIAANEEPCSPADDVYACVGDDVALVKACFATKDGNHFIDKEADWYGTFSGSEYFETTGAYELFHESTLSCLASEKCEEGKCVPAT